MRKPPPPTTQAAKPVRRRQILPIIIYPRQNQHSSSRIWSNIRPVHACHPTGNSRSSCYRLLSLLIVGSCGIWIFVMGILIEHLPPGEGFPLLPPSADDDPATTAASSLPFPSSTLDRYPTPQLLLDRRRNTESLVHADHNLDERTAHAKSNQRLHQQHQIPKILIFTHAINLLTYEPPKNINDQQHIVTNNYNKTRLAEKEVRSEQDELLALQKNVQRTIKMHPDATVRFLTDEDCINALRAVLGPNAPLIQFFQQETQGMYKADICRGAALWETGGIYLDVDVGVRMALWGSNNANADNYDLNNNNNKQVVLLHANTTFATNFVHRDSNYVGCFFQAFMATTPNHAITERYLHLFLLHYQGKLTKSIKKGPLGVILLRQAFDDVMILEAAGENGVDLLLPGDTEILAVDSKPFHMLTDREKQFRLGPTTIDTTHYGRIQLWQEVQYQPKYFPNVPPVPGLNNNSRRACHFVVVANKKFPLIVPFYSRIAGSRMCPAETAASEK